MEVPIEIIAFLGITIGVLARTYLPWKQKEDEKSIIGIKFDPRFIITAILSVIISSAMVFNIFVMPGGSMFQVFIAAMIFGYGTNSALNALAK